MQRRQPRRFHAPFDAHLQSKTGGGGGMRHLRRSSSHRRCLALGLPTMQSRSAIRNRFHKAEHPAPRISDPWSRGYVTAASPTPSASQIASRPFKIPHSNTPMPREPRQHARGFVPWGVARSRQSHRPQRSGLHSQRARAATLTISGSSWMARKNSRSRARIPLKSWLLWDGHG